MTKTPFRLAFGDEECQAYEEFGTAVVEKGQTAFITTVQGAGQALDWVRRAYLPNTRDEFEKAWSDAKRAFRELSDARVAFEVFVARPARETWGTIVGALKGDPEATADLFLGAVGLLVNALLLNMKRVPANILDDAPCGMPKPVARKAPCALASNAPRGTVEFGPRSVGAAQAPKYIPGYGYLCPCQLPDTEFVCPSLVGVVSLARTARAWTARVPLA